MGNARLSVLPMSLGRRSKYREFGCRLVRVRQMDRRQRAGRPNLRKEKRGAGFLTEHPVVRAQSNRPEELTDHALVHVRVLAQVDGRKMKGEDVNGAAQQAKPASCQSRRSVARQRVGENVQVLQKLGRLSIKGCRTYRRPGRLAPGKHPGGRS